MLDSLNKRICPGAVALLVCMVFSTGEARANTAVPLPLNKPLITDVAQIVEPSSAIPVPLSKPDFSRPALSVLLGFGQAPVPGKKPMRSSSAPLEDDDALLYRKIFAYQATGEWDRADELMTGLRDLRLRGHILFQRYMHPTGYKADFGELASWMDNYADHPGADKIYKLARKRIPANYEGSLREPVESRGINGYLEILSDRNKVYRSPLQRTQVQLDEISRLNKEIDRDLAKGSPEAAQKKLDHDPARKLLDEAEYDELRAQIANRYFVEGKPAKARELALESARRSGAQVPLAGWVGGLVAWQQGDYKAAAPLFELTANSPYSSEWTVAAGAYWASRAHMRAGRSQEVTYWLRRAATHPRTFYGLIATRALGWDFDFNWTMPTYTAEHKKLLMQYPGARRAMLLVEAGQFHLAEQELGRLDPKASPKLTEALLAFANRAGLPSYAMRLASSITAPSGRLYDAALYPMLPWTPQSGFKVDRALIHALIRQESRFNPMAESGSGATGLMQLMPATASFISGKREYRSREGRHSLKDPQVNLDIGQRYVEDLLRQDLISTELFSLVIAYNAGPGNLKKWKDAYQSMQDDPLLFVESIPMGETRAFVERVMANYWIYRLRMEQPTPTLDAVAEGEWAHYIRLDDTKQAQSLSEKSYLLADTSDYQ